LPVEYTISQEEQAILWRSLEKIPATYREPLVLFYREHQSVEAVAEELELSVDTVHQRLSRGRKLLQEQVLAFVEGALKRTSPGKTFTLGVIAALPLAATTAKAATAGAAVAKGGALAKATGLATLFQTALKFFLPVGTFISLGGWLGYKMGGDAGQSPSQRQSVARFWNILAGSLILFVFLPVLLAIPLMLLFGSKENFLVAFRLWLDVLFVVVVAAFGFWLWQRRKSRRQEAAVVGGKVKRLFLWSLALATILAGAFLALAMSDSNWKIDRIPSAQAQKIITSKGRDAEFFVMRSFYHSAFKQSDQYYDDLWIKFQEDGKVCKFVTSADAATLALLAQQGINCPTYVQGRDFGVFGWQGRLLMPLLLLILAAGTASLLTISLKNKTKTPIMTKGTTIGIVAAVVLAALIVTPLVWLNHRKANSVRPHRTAMTAMTTELTPERATQAKQTATDFFDALGKGDWNQIAKLCPPGFALDSELNQQQKDSLAGLQVVSLGEPFKKAPYPGVFVPYEIRFQNGEVKKFQLAVRQDNSENRWYFDGGL
jgi:lipopolysaccharide/colanic/teichoic acid biosynthesis glycosyltransferase